MKVAFFLPSISKRGGVERATISLINALCQEGINVSLVVFNDIENSAFLIDNRVKVIPLNITNYKLQFFQLFYRLRETIKESKIDVFVSVESMTLLFSLIPLLSIRNRPKLVVWEHFNFYNNNGVKLRDQLRKLAAKKADLVITLTARDEQTWKSKFAFLKRITHIFNISPFDVRESYDANSKTAIAIGRYVPVKGFERLIESWCYLSENYDIGDWKLMIIGYGELEEKLKNLIRERNVSSIKLQDGKVDVSSFYEQSSIYCMSSYYEGLPMAMIEAQTFGLPSVAFDIYTGPSEIIDNKAGILVPDGDTQKYAEAMFKLISNSQLRMKMSDNALILANRFTAESIAKDWIDKFDRLN